MPCPLPCSTRFIKRFVAAGVMLVAALLTGAPLGAAEDTWWQRLLPAPEKAPADLLRQLRLMQELQRQIEAGESTPVPPMPDSELLKKLRDSLPPEERRALENTLRNFKPPASQQLPAEAAKDAANPYEPIPRDSDRGAPESAQRTSDERDSSGRDTGGRDSSNSDSDERVPSPRRATSPGDARAAPRGAVPLSDGLREKLSDADLQKTLREIFQEARTEAKRTSRPVPETGAPVLDRAAGAMESALLGSLDLAREDIVELAAEWRDAAAKNRAADRASPADSTPHKRGQDFTKRATELFRDWTAPSTPKPVGATAGDPYRRLTPALWALAGLGLVSLAGVLVWWYRGRLLAESSGAALSGGCSIPPEIRTREDIVLAFDALVASTTPPTARWWPHRRSARFLSTSRPAAGPAVDALADLYEIARYTPRERSISAEQLATARDAVEQLRKC